MVPLRLLSIHSGYWRVSHLTSRAETNCSGLSALFMSGMLVSSSYRAVAMLVSISEGLAREGLLGAILFRACCDIMAVVGRTMCCCVGRENMRFEFGPHCQARASHASHELLSLSLPALFSRR